MITHKKSWLSKVVCVALSGTLLAGISGCTEKKSASTDILTQQTLSKEKTTITVLVKYAFTVNSFEKAVEEKFPNIDIVQVGNYTRNMGTAEYAARLEHDDLTDIVMTWPLDIGEEYWSDRLLDLSGYDFTSRYNLSMLNDISQDGKLYYIPGPSQVRGIIYNKTLFEEKGWQVPSDFDGFVKLCQTIEDSGMRSLQLGLQNAEVLDTAFVGYSLADCYSKPQDTQWLSEYDEGKYSFGEHFTTALDTFQQLIDGKVLQKSDLEIDYAEREAMLFTRKCAMVEDSVLMARMGYAQTGTTDEFALMPFFNPNGGEDWARLYMVCYIGLNKHLVDAVNKDKYELVMKLMDYISTAEGQAAMMGDTGAMYSSLIGVGAPDIEEIADMLPALKAGRYAIFPELKNAQSALREGLAGMVSGDTTKEDVIEMVDAENASPAQAAAPVKLGTASENFTLIETGDFVTDVLREESGCDISLFLDNGKDGKYNGKGISARLYEGDVTQTDLERVLPDLKHGETGTMWKVEMTGANLIQTLENSITVDNGSGGWFYYFSGLKMQYAPAAEPGKRIRKITTANGKEIEPDQTYSIAVMDETVPEEYIVSCEKTDRTIMDILADFIKKSETIEPAKDGRFTVIES